MDSLSDSQIDILTDSLLDSLSNTLIDSQADILTIILMDVFIKCQKIPWLSLIFIHRFLFAHD